VNRFAAALLAIIGGAAIALGVLMIGTGAVAGLLWIFVFGDDPWPGWAMTTLNVLIPIVGLLLWAIFGWQIWLRLKRML
jgi:hypothetical protein